MSDTGPHLAVDFLARIRNDEIEGPHSLAECYWMGVAIGALSAKLTQEEIVSAIARARAEEATSSALRKASGEG